MPGVPGAQRMFLGKHDHSLDSKGRLTLPADFRSELGDQVVLTPSPEGNVSIWNEEGFDEQVQRIMERVRSGDMKWNAARLFANRANKVNLDSHGRIVVPPALRSHAALDRDVVVSGAFHHVEIWNPERYASVEEAGASELDAADPSLSAMTF